MICLVFSGSYICCSLWDSIIVSEKGGFAFEIDKSFSLYVQRSVVSTCSSSLEVNRITCGTKGKILVPLILWNHRIIDWVGLEETLKIH